MAGEWPRPVGFLMPPKRWWPAHGIDSRKQLQKLLYGGSAPIWTLQLLRRIINPVTLSSGRHYNLCLCMRRSPRVVPTPQALANHGPGKGAAALCPADPSSGSPALCWPLHPSSSCPFAQSQPGPMAQRHSRPRQAGPRDRVLLSEAAVPSPGSPGCSGAQLGSSRLCYSLFLPRD